MNDVDIIHMRRALELAKLGYTAPNPMVGCVLVKNDKVVAEGYHHRPGMAHAEVEALREAGDEARGATAYVSLEPCSHTGKTPPCADALIKAGVSRVVAAMEDPNPRVHGQGFAKLRAAGIEVEFGVCEQEARSLNEMFIYAQTHDRPWVTAKFACSLDGRTAAADGSSQWITGDKAREYAHILRAHHDALLVGVGTVIADNPSLTVRNAAVDPQRRPVRVVVDTHLRIPLASALCDVSAAPTWVICAETADQQKHQMLQQRGVEILPVGCGSDGRICLRNALSELRNRGITAVLCDGGASLLGSLFDAHLVNRVTAFMAPMVIGGEALSAVRGTGAASIDAALRLHNIEYRQCGDDMMVSGLLDTI